jgi:hypothetical protein
MAVTTSSRGSADESLAATSDNAAREVRVGVLLADGVRLAVRATTSWHLSEGAVRETEDVRKTKAEHVPRTR